MSSFKNRFYAIINLTCNISEMDFRWLLVLLVLVSYHLEFAEMSFISRRSSPDSNLPHQKSVVLHPDRVNLLQDALSWLTIRKGGKLLNQAESKVFWDTIIKKYKESKYYRTLVIAFQLGVLPKLTLNESDFCDPTYTATLRDPFNNSVTDHYIKNFTFIGYYSRNNPSGFLSSGLCDYRKGLICNQSTQKCECPPGSKMTSVSPQDPDRCLLEKNQVCSLIDLDHWTSHKILGDHLPIMIFNLEKPPGCQNGLQCRFTKSEPTTSRCLGPESAGDFFAGESQLQLGRKCVLNLYTDNGGGMCGSNATEKLTCWNYGARSHPNSPEDSRKFGYCAHEYGEFIGNGVGERFVKDSSGQGVDFQPFVIPFVNPRTVPWPSDLNFTSFKKYLGMDDSSGLQGLVQKYFKVVQPHEEGVCSVEKTDKMKEIWRFYEALESQTSGFAASVTELEGKLKEAMGLVQGPEKICRVYRNIERAGGLTDNVGNALTCISISDPSDPNLGQCKETSFDETRTAAKTLKDFLDHDYKIRTLLSSQEKNVDVTILAENPESGCNPTLGNYFESLSAFYKDETQFLPFIDALEEEECPSGTVCVEELSDMIGIYDSNCNLIPTYQPQTLCHSLSQPLRKCERIHLQKKVKKALAEISQHAKLPFGAPCNYNIDSRVREAVRDPSTFNGYLILNLITAGKAHGGFCDATKLLQCLDSYRCGCVDFTEPRRASYHNSTLSSDYCYLTEGACTSDVTKMVAATASEKEKIMEHYASVEEIADDCTNGNVCLFLDQDGRKCVEFNTGKTGLEGGSKGKNSLNGIDRQYISGEKSILLSRPKTNFIYLISFVTIYFTS